MAPAFLVPAAWAVAAAAVAGIVSERPLLVAHLVMTVALVGFLAASWSEMSTGVLRVWRLVILAGVPVTLAGVAGFLGLGVAAGSLLAVSLFGWILLPGVGLAYTGLRVGDTAAGYYVGAGCCLTGAVGTGLGVTPTETAAGVLVVGVGQTIGIVTATVID